MNAKRDAPDEAGTPEPRGNEEEGEGGWGKADAWLAVVFLLTVAGIAATGLMTLIHAAGRLH